MSQKHLKKTLIRTLSVMKPSIVLIFLLGICSCHKSQTERKHEPNCGCDTDSVLNVAVDSVGWLSFDSASNLYSIHDTIQNNFLNIYWICNPESKDISSFKLPNDSAVAVYYSGKVKERCPDSLITIPEVFLYNITVDSLRGK